MLLLLFLMILFLPFDMVSYLGPSYLDGALPRFTLLVLLFDDHEGMRLAPSCRIKKPMAAACTTIVTEVLA
jgi:hypothetical protein